jgi:rod shape-determining protein MreC
LARLREDASAEMARTLRRIGLAGLTVVALVLFAFWRADSPRVEALRLQMADRFRPLLELTATPFVKAIALIEDWERFSTLHGQNRDLRREVERLRGWREAAQQLERENARLRALDNVQLSPRLAYTTAEVLADPRTPFGRSVLVSVGAKDGVADGSAAVDGNGLVGRIVGVGEDVARLLLLTDFSSRVPVKVLPDGQRGVLTGDGSPAPRLDFVADAAGLSLGARIVTSGDDGVFPPDIPVGVLASAGERVLRVGLAADYQLLDFVRILRWQRDTPRELTPLLVGPAGGVAPPAETAPAAPEAPEAPAITGALTLPVREPSPDTPRPAARPGG